MVIYDKMLLLTKLIVNVTQPTNNYLASIPFILK